MFRRSMFYFLILCAAVGIPYLSTEWNKTSQWLSSRAGSSETATATNEPAGPNSDATGLGNLAGPNSPVFSAVAPNGPDVPSAPPLVSLAEALRFDVTSPWILGRWPRVTAGLPDEDLQGYRVALVTGTRDDDLAGSLTYYFNKRQRCQRITFQGTTGDARKLIAYLTERYGFKQQTSNDPNLYLYQIRWNGSPLSELHIRPARIVRSNEPLARFEVLLAMNDTSGK
ncbi:MAG TPA: DUF6690 family protein [Pirellulales bacterium]|jgi:hypothetical protein|nr:DUF6690 family protein [Pirellulales bacterium]